MAEVVAGDGSTGAGEGAAVALEGVSVRYGAERDKGGLLAVDRVSFRVEAGEFVSLVGPSGCGKSSLLRVIGGLQSPSEGSVSVLGAAPRQAQASKRLGLVPQEPALLPWRSVVENLRLPLEVNRDANHGPDRVGELLALVGLESFAAYRPHELSGGMQQRVALARALVIDPDVLLMDEPLASLDEITREQMRYELLRIWSAAGERSKSVVFVTHSVAEAVTLSDRVVVMSQQPGRVKAEIEIDLPRPRRAEDQRGDAFLDYVERIRDLLRDEVAEVVA